MAIAGTYEGARATAGSSAWWNLAQKDSIGGAVVTTNIETYGPTSGKPTLVRKGDDPYGRRSVAFTNIAPNAAAQSLAGNGPAAVASGGLGMSQHHAENSSCADHESARWSGSSQPPSPRLAH
jgi:hypothetical protein